MGHRIPVLSFVLSALVSCTGAGPGPADLITVVDGGAGDGRREAPDPVFLPPPAGLTAGEIGVLVNTDDPQSVAVADYYQRARGVPAANVVHLALGKDLGTSIGADTFQGWKSLIDAALDARIQALAVTWTAPSQVDCMSLTSALAFGFDRKWCKQGMMECGTTAPSPYFNADGNAPFTRYGLRPAMILAGTSTADVIKLIDRGVAADGSFPPGDGYLLRTTDADRSVRYPQFVAAAMTWNRPDSLVVNYIDNGDGHGMDFIQGRKDVLFYLTGLASVPEITSNQYRPGAVADHLTSFGGQIPQSGQMSILRWIEAGATASYGTVVEPCNYTEKFPDAGVLLPRYFLGDTVIEAYWKSVKWPGEGLFIGEPLARPWGTTAQVRDGMLEVSTTSLVPNTAYVLQAAPTADGPWTAVMSNIQVSGYQRKTITLARPEAAFYRLSVM